MGFGVILVDNRRAHYVDMGVIDLRREKDHFKKLHTIANEVRVLIERYAPNDMAIEAPFYGKNLQSMLKLGRAQGAAITAALDKNVPITEYAPRKVKLAITGKGAASKEQVKEMLERTMDVKLDIKYLDASEALAIAMCHFYQLTNPMTDTSASKDWKSFIAAHSDRVKK